LSVAADLLRARSLKEFEGINKLSSTC